FYFSLAKLETGLRRHNSTLGAVFFFTGASAGLNGCGQCALWETQGALRGTVPPMARNKDSLWGRSGCGGGKGGSRGAPERSLCGANSGFIVGQNLLLDGGAFNSTMG